MSVIDVVKESWGWTGIDPVEIVAMNPFGNLVVRDSRGEYWRLAPEDLLCQVVAKSGDELSKLFKDPEFAEDWEMRALVKAAHDKLGALESGRRYCLKLPGPLGGAYEAANLATLPIEELIGFTGYLAEQIKDLPDGASFRFTFPGEHAA